MLQQQFIDLDQRLKAFLAFGFSLHASVCQKQLAGRDSPPGKHQEGFYISVPNSFVAIRKYRHNRGDTQLPRLTQILLGSLQVPSQRVSNAQISQCVVGQPAIANGFGNGQRALMGIDRPKSCLHALLFVGVMVFSGSQ
ncbi:hypothetical protein [Roseateles oligotrophus]|uniref:hypothetical protein n=1 Tax=Roseateles oligotrophus TaxID=1769250 RepID=UPI0021E47E5A|nr:hypothetical protein [Roseateles oligotrophus]